MSSTQRVEAIDIVRGILILCMVAFHSLYMAVTFKFSALDLWSGFWWWFARVTAAGFVLLAGWSYAAQSARERTPARYPDMARRSLKLGAIALAISIITFFAFGATGFVFFGVIHLISVCYLAAWPLRNRPWLAALTAAGILAAGLFLGKYSFERPWLAWLGFRPTNLFPADYLPLLPWAAWFFFGIAVFPATSRAFSELTRKTAQNKRKPLIFPLRQLAFAGKHSLTIYLVHLPTLYGLAWLLSLLFPALHK